MTATASTTASTQTATRAGLFRRLLSGMALALAAAAMGASKPVLAHEAHAATRPQAAALRTAAFEESVTILATSTIPVTMLPWTDERIHGVPSTRVRMRPWLGGNDAAQVAPAEHVLELLTLAATTLQRQKAVQGDMLRRLMGA